MTDRLYVVFMLCIRILIEHSTQFATIASKIYHSNYDDGKYFRCLNINSMSIQRTYYLLRFSSRSMKNSLYFCFWCRNIVDAVYVIVLQDVTSASNRNIIDNPVWWRSLMKQQCLLWYSDACNIATKCDYHHLFRQRSSYEFASLSRNQCGYLGIFQ